MKLQNLKQSYQTRHTQFMAISNNGIVVESDNILFDVPVEQNISNIHPFFESTLNILENTECLMFSCVHIDFKEQAFICDVEIKVIDPYTYIIIVNDFSKHYNSFKSLVQSRNQSAIQSEILILNNQLLMEKEVFKNKFIANFSHEVKNPITSIISFSNLLKDTKLNNEQLEYLDIINSSSFHLNSIINDVLDISNFETGKLEIKLAFFDIYKLIDRLRIKYNLKCKDKNLAFNVIIDKEIPNFIESDKTRISQLIQNLLDNAIKFTEQGTISLEIKHIYKRAQNLTLSIIVKDTGIGIEQKYYKTIFQRFNRLKSSKNEKGLGLGLAIVKEIIELMHAELYIESEPNIGSTFIINFKTKSLIIHKKQAKKTTQKVFKDDFKKKPNRKHNILLVEDNTKHQLGVFKLLAKTKLYYLDIVSNGIDAIKHVNKTNYDLILMDFKLPSLNGLETTKSIRNLSDKHKSNIPIIMVTGSNITNLLEQKDTLSFDIIKKPYNGDTLIKSIQKSLKK